MTKNEFKQKAKRVGDVREIKYSGKQKIFFCRVGDSFTGEKLVEIAKGSHFKVKYG